MPRRASSRSVSCLARLKIVTIAGLAVLLLAGRAQADPSGNVLTNWSQTGMGLITDGTSNTLLFGETTQLAVCLDGVSIQGSPLINTITDGSSNTIQFSEANPFRVNVGRVFSRQPISQIVDGTSNTIQFGEVQAGSFCLGGVTPLPPGITDGTSNTIQFGEDSQFDVCVDNAVVSSIQDGTSNTILFEEAVPRSCFEGVRVRGAEGGGPGVPEPAALLIFGLSGVAALARRRAR